MKNNFKKGFTLVEMLIAISLFIVVVTISIGALVTIFDANKKAQSSKTVVDNLNLAIENMARTIRFGDHYYCGVSTNTNAVNNCPNGGTDISVTFNSNRVIYYWDGTGPIQRSDDGAATYTNITSSDTHIQYLMFYVFGTNPSPDTQQPYVLAVIKGYVGDSNKPSVQTSFSIETLMSQRKLDNNI